MKAMWSVGFKHRSGHLFTLKGRQQELKVLKVLKSKRDAEVAPQLFYPTSPPGIVRNKEKGKKGRHDQAAIALPCQDWSGRKLTGRC